MYARQNIIWGCHGTMFSTVKCAHRDKPTTLATTVRGPSTGAALFLQEGCGVLLQKGWSLLMVVSTRHNSPYRHACAN